MLIFYSVMCETNFTESKFVLGVLQNRLVLFSRYLLGLRISIVLIWMCSYLNLCKYGII